jgi:hypothetical protein
VPFTRRATTSVVFGIVAAFVLPITLTGCSAHRDATGFCATIRGGHSAFDSVDESRAPVALAEFDRVAAKAPTTVATDLKTVSAVLHLLYRDPASVAKDPALFERYVAATKHFDSYLHQTCGVSIPPPGKFF